MSGCKQQRAACLENFTLQRVLLQFLGVYKLEPYRFLLDSLAAPFGSSCQEPGDGEYDPPDDPCHREEIKQHKKQSAAFAVRAQHHGFHRSVVIRFGAGGAVSDQEAEEVHERDDAVADCVEDYGTLWVSEALDVDEEREEGEESGAQADDGAHADEALGELDVVRSEVHVGAGRSAVLGAEERGAVARLGLQLQRAPEAEVSLQGRGGHRGGGGKGGTIRPTRFQSRGQEQWQDETDGESQSYSHLVERFTLFFLIL